MDMNINRLPVAGYTSKIQQPVVKEEETPQQPVPPQLSDSVDFTDGANNVIELAVLPSVDTLLGQVISNGIQGGNIARVSGKITTDNGEKQLAEIKYEMRPNLAVGKLNTKGHLLTDPEKNLGTFVNEEMSQDPNDAFSAKVEGIISSDAQSEDKNENLKVTVGLGSFNTNGKVNGFEVDETTSVELFGTITQQGNIAGKPFQRKLVPDFSTGNTSIQGKLGDMDETGIVGLAGSGIMIDRKIGPYHIQEMVTFSPMKKEGREIQ